MKSFSFSNMAGKDSSSYFRLPNIIIMILIGVGMIMLGLCVYCPYVVHYYYYLGRFIADKFWYLAKIRPRLGAAVWYGAVALHVLQATFAYHLANHKGITNRDARKKWFVSTLCFGIGSLWLLIRYDPKVHSIVYNLLQELDDDVGHDPHQMKSELVSVLRNDKNDNDDDDDAHDDDDVHDDDVEKLVL